MEELIKDPIIGATIVSVRQMTKQEMIDEGWEFSQPGNTTVLVLSNGAILYPSADWEGNGPGALFGKASDNQAFYIFNTIK